MTYSHPVSLKRTRMEKAYAIEIPSYFLCPISLQIMRDPVTLPTGITYDRHSIERWIYTENHPSCPVTNQTLVSDSDSLITPNVTLRRLIQGWCITKASQGIERFPTPRPPVTKSLIADLIRDAATSSSSSDMYSNSLRQLKSIVSESDRNRRCVEASSGAVDFLATIVKNSIEQEQEDALSILHSLQLSEQSLVNLLHEKKHQDFVETLASILSTRSTSSCYLQSRVYAILLLKSLLFVASPFRLMALSKEFFVNIVNVLNDKISYQATKAALQVLSGVTPYGSNKTKAVEAKVVNVIIELLMDDELTERSANELMLSVLSRLSECAEGRAEIVAHAAGIAVVSKKLVRVSVLASKRAMRILYLVAKSSPTLGILKEMVEVGVVSKMLLLMQVDCGEKTKERAKEMLRLHATVWRNSPCIPPQLRRSYPVP